ncbi:MAG: hypothetical protein RBS57_10680 [Desulforhabdus sp.]|jgi:hypothetical protein|nr:hypothetical protein [Desulforhabdus sp.]
MASKSQKTEKIRARKSRANKDNLKKREKQLQANLEVLQRVVREK